MSPVRSRKRRDRHLDDVEAVIEILAEAAGLDLLDQPLVGRGDDADVDLARVARADRLDLARLQHAQQLDLRLERHLADLVEEQGAAIGILRSGRSCVRTRR